MDMRITKWCLGILAACGVLLGAGSAYASGDVVWNAGKAGVGFHAPPHVSGGEILTAIFAVGQVATVTFDRQGGDGGVDSILAIYGIAMPSVAVPSRAGCVSEDYFSGPNGEGIAYCTAEGTLYAHWKEATALSISGFGKS